MVGILAGAGLVTAAFALAAGVGSQPGNLILSAANGPLTSTPTWQTTDGCPSNFQSSANVAEFTVPGGVKVSVISSAINGGVMGPFGPAISGIATGTLDGNVAALFSFAGISASSGGTVEWAVGCWNGPGGTGTVEYTQSILVSVAPGASTYTTSTAAPSGTPSTGTSSSTAPPPSASQPASMHASAAASPSPATSPTSAPTATSAPTRPSQPSASTIRPASASASGGGGSSGTGPSALLIALGATVLVASLAAAGLAILRRRARALAWTAGAMAPSRTEDQ